MLTSLKAYSTWFSSLHYYILFVKHKFHGLEKSEQQQNGIALLTDVQTANSMDVCLQALKRSVLDSRVCNPTLSLKDIQVCNTTSSL